MATVLADGTPVSCRVQVEKAIHFNQEIAPGLDGIEAFSQPITTVTTNQYGLAQVDLPNWVFPWDQSNPALKVIATDSTGRKGSLTQNLWFQDQPMLSLNTDKGLYRRGDPISVTLESNQKPAEVLVKVLQNDDLLFSQLVKLTSGSGKLTIPFRPEFQGEVTVVAYAPQATDPQPAWQPVLFPKPAQLRLTLTKNQATYRPGAAARVGFQVTDAQGRTVESALGVVVKDAAVDAAFTQFQLSHPDEFATWSTFGGEYPYNRLVSLGGRNRDTLAAVIQKKGPVSPEVQMAAKLFLRLSAPRPVIPRSSWNFSQSKRYRDPWEPFTRIKVKLLKHLEAGNPFPQNLDELSKVVTVEGLVDAWYRPYRFVFSNRLEHEQIKAVSTGPDGRLGTADDLLAFHLFDNPFFRVGKKIGLAIQHYRNRIGQNLTTAALLKQELHKLGVEFDKLHDDWGQPFRLDFLFFGEKREFLVMVKSSGPNRKFETGPGLGKDDRVVWAEKISSGSELKRGFAEANWSLKRKNWAYSEDPG